MDGNPVSITTTDGEGGASYPDTPAGKFQRWLIEIQEAERWFKPWMDASKKVIRRYRDERRDALYSNDADGRRLNVLWSNVETLKPALYARRPKPVVSRRFKDKDQVGKVSADVLERASTFSIDNDAFDELMQQVRDDYLLTARGTAWVRYVPHFVTPETPADGVSVTDDAGEYEAETEAQEQQEVLAYEEVCLDYVYWRDFLHAPAKVWREVRWVARCVQMTRAELIERFGEEIGRAVPLDVRAAPSDGDPDSSESRIRNEITERANVYEIWDKGDRKVCWIAKGYDKGLLDERDDPLRLKEFFPCPRPLFATLTTDTLIPVPDFEFYKDQADDLDDVTNRLSMLTKACKAAGVYDATQDDKIGRLLQEGGDLTLIPANNFMAFAERGGLKGTVDLLDLSTIIAAIAQLTERSEALKAQIYEITGISDIVRGYSAPSETATAQQIKGQFAALRLQARQQEVARFARDLVAMTAEIISEHFQPQTVMLMTGVELPTQADVQMQMAQAAMQYQQAAQMAQMQGQQPPPPPQMPQPPVTVEDVFGLLRNDAIRNFRIEIETDSTIAADEQADKAAATEFLTAFGQFFAAALPMAQQAPELLPLFGAAANFLARRFRAGRELEGAIEQSFEALNERATAMANAPPQPDPAMVKADAEVKAIQAKTEAEIGAMQAKTQAGLEAQNVKMQGQMALQAMKAQMQPQQPVGVA